MSPMERLKELVDRLNAHIERLDVDGATPDNRMTYDDLGDIAAVLKALASDDAVERMARAHCAWDGPCGYSKCPEDGKTCRGNITENELLRMRAALSALPSPPHEGKR